MKVKEIVNFELIAVCPYCEETVSLELEEVLVTGGYCIECGNDFDLLEG